MRDSATAKQNKPNRVIIVRANPLSPDPRVMKMARTLHRAGYQPSLVGWNMTMQHPASELLDGIPCYRLPVRANFGRGVVNILHQIRWQLALLNWLVKHREEYQIIHACDFDTVLAALVSKLLLGKFVVYDIFDFYADMLRATPTWIKQFIRYVDLKAIGWVDALILADDSRFEQIHGSRPKRSQVIYNTLEDMTASNQAPQASTFLQAGLRLAYFGNLQVERGLLVLLDVLQAHPEWHLDLGGFGADETLIKAKASQLSNVNWHGLLPYEQVIKLSAKIDVLIATYDPHIPNNRYASPNKLFEAMMLGKPIIVAQDTNMDRIVSQTGCGLVVSYGDQVGLEDALSQLSDLPEMRARLGMHAREAFENTYNWKAMEERLLQLYASLGNDQ